MDKPSSSSLPSSSSSIDRSRFIGCILGKAVGDAIGFPVEGRGPRECTEYITTFDAHTRPTIGRDRYQFGQYTDDTQLTRELLLTFIETRDFVPELFAKKVVDLFLKHRITGIGNATFEAALKLNNGIPWDQAGTPPPAAGNGTAMRAAAVGMMFPDDEEKLIQVATDQSYVTHQDPRCTAGSVIIARVISLILGGKDDFEEIINHVIPLITDISSLFSEELENLRKWIKLKPEEAADHIIYSGKPDFKDGWPGISPYVIPTVLWSLYSFFTNKEEYMAAIKRSIWIGGDTDTTAAITGALSGAYLGVEKIPQVYLDIINDHDEWKAVNLTDLAENVYKIVNDIE